MEEASNCLHKLVPRTPHPKTAILSFIDGLGVANASTFMFLRKCTRTQTNCNKVDRNILREKDL